MPPPDETIFPTADERVCGARRYGFWAPCDAPHFARLLGGGHGCRCGEVPRFDVFIRRAVGDGVESESLVFQTLWNGRRAR